MDAELEEVTKEELYKYQDATEEWTLLTVGDKIKLNEYFVDNNTTRVVMVKGLNMKGDDSYKINVEISSKSSSRYRCFEIRTNELKGRCLYCHFLIFGSSSD